MTEEPHQIPPTWVWTNVDTLYDVIGGGTPSTKIEKYWKGDVPWITSADINDVKKIVPRKYITKEAIQNSATKLVPENSIIVVTRVGLGKVALTEYPLCFSQDSQALVGDNSLINPNYSVYYLSIAVQEFKYKHRGTTIAGVPRKQLKQLPFPLPPYNEQVRIVGRVEELFSRLDAGVRSLQAAQTLLEQYRQTILIQAYTGKLTQKWRQKNNVALDEDFIKLKDKINFDFQPIDFFPIPYDWKWIRLGELNIEIKPGFPKGKWSYDPNFGVPHIRPMNINIKGKIDFSKLKYVEPNDYDYLLKNDVLFNNTNSPEMLGKTAYIEKDTNWAYSNHMTRLRIKTNKIVPKYLVYYLNTLFYVKFYKMNCTHHVNQASFNTKQISNFYIPYCSPIEQQQIIDKIEHIMSYIDKILMIIADTKNKPLSLKQSILRMAFMGRLIPQDPRDEPASVLLDRIKAQRVKQKRLI